MALKSSSNTTIPPSYHSETTTTDLRNASFSSYLRHTQKNHIHSLNKTPKNLNYHQYTSPNPKAVEKEGELDVFPADKYFNGLIHRENTILEKYQTDKATISLSKLQLQPRTPSIHSESSWNSQSALLRPPLRNPPRNESIRGKKPLFLSCYCCDTKSVDVESDTEFRDRNNSSSFNDECNRGITTTRIKTSFDICEITRFKTVKVGNEEEEEDERRRKTSLEVFGSNNDWPKESKRFNMVPWDTPGLPSGTYDDTDSDASSDLFELECLSCTANPVDPNGFIGGSSPTTGYAPSEASVDWSVVTASVADFSDQASTITSVTRSKAGPKSKPAGILSGCKSQKAVMVASDAYRSCDKRKLGESRRIRHRFSDSFTRFQGEGKLVGDGISQFKRKSGSDFLKHF